MKLMEETNPYFEGAKKGHEILQNKGTAKNKEAHLES